MGRDAAALGLEVPERAVERVAGGARRHRFLERDAVEPALDRAPLRLDRRSDAFDGLAVAGIGHAFAAPDGVALGDRDRDHDGLGAGAAGDGEPAGDREALGRDRQAGALRLHLNHAA